jgi:hypothetical protein
MENLFHLPLSEEAFAQFSELEIFTQALQSGHLGIYLGKQRVFFSKGI